jgi:hypothetical protein
MGVAQTSRGGAGAGLTPDIGAGPSPGTTLTPSTIPNPNAIPDPNAISDPNAQLLQPSLQGNPAKPPRFRKPGIADDQTPPDDTFAPSRIGATPKYGSPQGFGAGDTGFNSLNLSARQKKKLMAQAPPPPAPGVELPETTFDTVPTTQFEVPPVPPVRPAAPAPEVYPVKAGSRPGALPPPLYEPLPISNVPPEVHPLPAANRPGAGLPVPPPIELDNSASTPMPGTQPLNTYPLGTPVQRPAPIVQDDPYSAVGIRGGSFLFFPSVELSSGADSNPEHIPGGPSSLYFVVAPELQVQSDWSRHSLTADLRGSYTDYTSDSLQPSLNRPYFNSTIDGRIDVTRDTQLVLENRVLVTTDNPGNPNLQAGLASLPIETTVGGTFGIVQNFSRLLVSVKGLIDRSIFGDSKLTDGETASNTFQNYNQYAAVARVGYEIDPGMKPFVEVQEDERIHDAALDINGQQRDSTGTSVKVGATLALYNTLTGEIAFGYLNRDYKDPNLPEINGPSLDGVLTWQATPLTSAKLTASTVANESILQNVSGSLSHDVSVEVDHALRRWLVLNGIVGYGRDQYVGLGRDDNRYFGSVGATYKLNREVQLKGEVRHDWLTSNISGVAYNATSVLLTLRLQR